MYVGFDSKSLMPASENFIIELVNMRKIGI